MIYHMPAFIQWLKRGKNIMYNWSFNIFKEESACCLLMELVSLDKRTQTACRVTGCTQCQNPFVLLKFLSSFIFNRKTI